MIDESPFAIGRPIIVRIERVNDQWTIRPSTTDLVNPDNPSGGKICDAMKQRQAGIEPAVLDRWQQGRAGGAPKLPHFKTEAGHVPIVIHPRETVQFICQDNLTFSLWVTRDPNVTVAPNSRSSPFGLYVPQRFQGGQTPELEVLTNIHDQRFYKCTAWIDLGNGEIEVVDPDVIGDGL